MRHPSVIDTTKLAVRLHADQVDKLGAPYYLHPIRVMTRLGTAASDAEKHAALLHDVLEDVSGATPALLRSHGYAEEVIKLCQLLERRKDESYRQFIDRIIASGNASAMRIKLADLYDNTSEHRAAAAPDALRAQLTSMAETRYRPAIAQLRNALGALADTIDSGEQAVQHVPGLEESDGREQRWRNEAARLSEGPILSRVPIRLIKKEKRFQPWYLPMFWLARSGVFALMPFVVVTRDVVDACPPRLVRPILAHEIAHLRKMHSAFWLAFVLLFFQLIGLFIAFAADAFGPYGPVFVLAVMLAVAGVATIRIQYWFERSADDYAVQVAGLEQTIEAIKWAKQHIHGNRSTPWIDSRISRLEACRAAA